MRWRSKLKIFDPGLAGWLILLFHAIYLSQISALSITKQFVLPIDFPRLLLSFVPVYLLVQAVRLAFSFNRWCLVTAELCLVSLYTLSSAYVLNSAVQLDYAVVRDNFETAVGANSLSVIIAAVYGWPILFAAVSIPIVILVAVLRKPTTTIFLRRSLLSATGYLVMYAAVVGFSKAQTTDAVTGFFRSAIGYYSFKTWSKDEIVKLGYPFVRKDLARSRQEAASRKMPSVFVIALESFGAHVVGRRTDDGQAITPVLDKLKRRGLSVEHYYGNSVQTAKGQFAILASTIPTFYGKEFTLYADRNFQTVADVAKNNGYKTVFFTAYSDGSFDNTEQFMRHHGFEYFESLNAHLKPEDAAYNWGWGPEDHILYRRSFEFLDKLEHSSPYFVFLATVNNHMNFDVPPQRRMLVAEPKNFAQKYYNSVALSDHHLDALFDELDKRDYLKDSIVIITADHSFPSGEHRITRTEIGAYENSFRVPCVVIAPGINRQSLSTAAYSHLDIAPTIVDLSGMKLGPHHFLGQSLLKPRPDNPVYLVQPYNGRFLGVVVYPFKYVKHMATRTEYLYDLSVDPQEAHNLAASSAYTSQLASLRKHLDTIYLSQALIQWDRLWPGPGLPKPTY